MKKAELLTFKQLRNTATHFAF